MSLFCASHIREREKYTHREREADVRTAHSVAEDAEWGGCFYRGQYSAGVTWQGRFPEGTYTCPGESVSDRLCVIDQ